MKNKPRLKGREVLRPDGSVYAEIVGSRAGRMGFRAVYTDGRPDESGWVWFRDAVRDVKRQFELDQNG